MSPIMAPTTNVPPFSSFHFNPVMSLFSYIFDKLVRLWFYIFDRLILYPLLGWLTPSLGINFLNLGYLPNEDPCDPEDHTMKEVVDEYSEKDDKDRAHYFLYEKPLSLHPQYPELNGIRILDVGCGQGNGIRWLKRAHPFIGSIKGVDGCVVHPQPYISKGSAEEIPFRDNYFDVVLNVESSHLYKNCDKFFEECKRVLKPGGFLCWIDLRYMKDVYNVKQQAREAGLNLEKWRDVTQNVLHGIYATAEHYDRQLKKAPLPVRLFSSSIRATYCAPGTHTYARFKKREKGYFAALWKKTDENELKEHRRNTIK